MRALCLLLLIIITACGKGGNESSSELKSKLDQLTLPSNNPSILEQPSDEIIRWLIEVDRWKLRVLSTPLDSFSEKDKQNIEYTLQKIFSQKITTDLIETFYVFDTKTITYIKKNIGHNTLDTTWKYEPVIIKVVDSKATISLFGKKIVDSKIEINLNHNSIVEIQKNEIRFTEFITKE